MNIEQFLGCAESAVSILLITLITCSHDVNRPISLVYMIAYMMWHYFIGLSKMILLIQYNYYSGDANLERLQ